VRKHGHYDAIGVADGKTAMPPGFGGDLVFDGQFFSGLYYGNADESIAAAD
jgi:hypothetical protein